MESTLHQNQNQKRRPVYLAFSGKSCCATKRHSGRFLALHRWWPNPSPSHCPWTTPEASSGPFWTNCWAKKEVGWSRSSSLFRQAWNSCHGLRHPRKWGSTSRWWQRALPTPFSGQWWKWHYEKRALKNYWPWGHPAKRVRSLVSFQLWRTRRWRFPGHCRKHLQGPRKGPSFRSHS